MCVQLQSSYKLLENCVIDWKKCFDSAINRNNLDAQRI